MEAGEEEAGESAAEDEEEKTGGAKEGSGLRGGFAGADLHPSGGEFLGDLAEQEGIGEGSVDIEGEGGEDEGAGEETEAEGGDGFKVVSIHGAGSRMDGKRARTWSISVSVLAMEREKRREARAW